jgi:DNA-binding NarL/FixJ family response regulator
MNEQISLVIADDHPVVRDGLRGMLASQADFFLAGEASDGEEAVRLVAELRPRVALIDLRMPRMDGVAAIQAITSRYPEMHVLVLTTYDSDADILRAIEAGATGYLLKDTPREELFQAVRSAAVGKSYLSPTVATRLVHQIRRPEETPLSERELEVLRRVAEGASNKEIAHHLHISETTVKTHLLHIFAKLDVSDRTQAVTVAIQRGIVSIRMRS